MPILSVGALQHIKNGDSHSRRFFLPDSESIGLRK